MNILIVCLLSGLLFFAIHRRRYVKLGLKLLGATLLIEATDEPGVHRESMSALLDPKQTGGSPVGSDQKTDRTAAS